MKVKRIPWYLAMVVGPYLDSLVQSVKVSAADYRRLTDPAGSYRLSVEQVEAVTDALRSVVSGWVDSALGRRRE